MEVLWKGNEKEMRIFGSPGSHPLHLSVTPLPLSLLLLSPCQCSTELKLTVEENVDVCGEQKVKHCIFVFFKVRMKDRGRRGAYVPVSHGQLKQAQSLHNPLGVLQHRVRYVQLHFGKLFAMPKELVVAREHGKDDEHNEGASAYATWCGGHSSNE